MTEPEEAAASILHDLHRAGKTAPASVRDAVQVVRERLPRATDSEAYAIGDALYCIVDRARNGTEVAL